MLEELFQKTVEDANRKMQTPEEVSLQKIREFFSRLIDLPAVNGKEFVSQCPIIKQEKGEKHRFVLRLEQSQHSQSSPAIKLGVKEWKITVTTYERTASSLSLGSHKYKKLDAKDFTNTDHALEYLATWAINAAPELIKTLQKGKVIRANKVTMNHAPKPSN